jgi:hypothetical protein
MHAAAPDCESSSPHRPPCKCGTAIRPRNATDIHAIARRLARPGSTPSLAAPS